ncbi:flavoprotein [Kitasatospora mediocidica]|uniref:flavoprotein n=1 Tax=Kitasatospora mediocidica TaxID=58352 RepID=UPI00056BFCF1|nr:flavoprotein [Kitasatospora mediocidica]
MPTDRVLYLLGSAAPPVLALPPVIKQAQAAGWDVCLGLSPTAADWLADDLGALESLTGHPVRHRHRRPGQVDPWPPAAVALVAPATFNTINSWALGLTSSFIVGFAAEAIGKRIPLVTMPCVNSALASHPQFGRSVDVLRDAGVRVLLGDGGFIPNAPGQGQPGAFPWERALAVVRDT